MPKIRWFHNCFDPNWVKCTSCRTEFFRGAVERKNKCPKCGRDNNGNFKHKLKQENNWEVCELWHDGKHPIRMAIRKDSPTRLTWCRECKKAVVFVRKEQEDVNPLDTM